MKILFATNFKKSSEMQVLPVWEGGSPAADFGSIDLQDALKDFKGKKGETARVYFDQQRYLLVGLGKREKACVEALREAYSNVVRAANHMKIEHIELLFPSCKQKEEFFIGIAEGICLSNYHFSYKTEEKESIALLKSATFVGLSKIGFVDEILIKAEGVHFVRDLINSNADEKREMIIKAAKSLGPEVKVTVFDKKRLEKEKMGLLLAVNRASSKEPALVIANYKGDPQSDKHIVLVGKGVTYDTGGYSLKPTSNMLEMKSDMGGAATALGALKVASELGLKVNVSVLMPLAENCIDSESYKLGDVYRSYIGKTVEINNTDAEGRLILADAIGYAAKNLNPSCIIDLATLTGACVVALGDQYSGLFSNDDDLSDALLEASDSSDELMWKMPVHDGYKKQLKSDIADLVNSGGRWAGAITAALFLESFTCDVPWAHIDIAGTAYVEKPGYYNRSKGTGYGVRLLTDFLKLEQ